MPDFNRQRKRTSLSRKLGAKFLSSRDQFFFGRDLFLHDQIVLLPLSLLHNLLIRVGPSVFIFFISFEVAETVKNLPECISLLLPLRLEGLAQGILRLVIQCVILL